MLCSHSKRFIYLKTKKTAGTSVEIFFERFCRPDGEFVESHAVHEAISNTGIVGCRMLQRTPNTVYYNHMPATEVRERLGASIFDSYFKFCVVRNPYDKLVSRFWWDVGPGRLSNLSFDAIRKCFNRYVSSRLGHLCDDRHIYMVNDVPVVDQFVRFERLFGDLADVCRKLDIDFYPTQVGSYKSGLRARPERYSEYYDAVSRTAVEQEFSFEIERFGYTFWS